MEENGREDQWLLEEKGGREIVWNEVQEKNLAGKFSLCNQYLHATNSKVKDDVSNTENNKKKNLQNSSDKVTSKLIESSFRGGFCLKNVKPVHMMLKASGHQCCDSHNWCKKNE